MSRDDVYFNPPDTYIRQKPDWTKDLDKQVAAYLKKGGKITQCADGESWYAQHYKAGNKHAFVINPNKENKLKGDEK
jgi:hypothetical protein